MKSDSNLEKLLESGKFVVTSELGPPKSADGETVRKKAQILKGFVDAVNITDNQTAIVRMSSIAAAVIVKEIGIEPVIQVVTRDRNRIAIQSDILGAAALGIKNVLCLTGDHQKFGNHPQSKNVFDMDSIQLIQMLKNMRDEKKFQCGEEIRNSKKEPLVEPKLFIGAAANPFADPLDFRVVRLAKKISAGADFIQTQPVFDFERFEKWMNLVREKNLHKKTAILAGVMPVKSVKALFYMKNNVPGMSIPDELINRLEKASDPKEERLKICVETIEKLKKTEGIRGVHIMAVEWEEIVPEIVKRAGLSPGGG
ncbi:MAG: methylenetetrahydrofolate reductase [Elusimicrobiota bacterium]|nr:methylenetetrahydrofolate reductase [Elusimicrobiota bacterium]